VSFTSGVVSRIELQEYAQASAELLAIQIDAAINAGNSGGPVLSDDGENEGCIGVAFQGLDGQDAESIGYVIPVQVLRHFLDAVALRGHFQGVPDLGVRWQELDNDALRALHGLGDKDNGVLVRDVDRHSPAAEVLRKGDVLMALDGHSIADDGSVEVEELPGQRLPMQHLFSMKFAGDEMPARVMRDRAVMELPVKLWVPKLLVPRNGFDSQLPFFPPVAEEQRRGAELLSYAVIGGVVLLRATQPLLANKLDTEGIMEDLSGNTNDDGVRVTASLLQALEKTRGAGDEDVVVVGHIFAHDSMMGYEELGLPRIVVGVNGESVRGLRHVCEVVSTSRERFISLELSCGTSVVMDRAEAKRATGEVCGGNGITQPLSEDLLDVGGGFWELPR